MDEIEELEKRLKLLNAQAKKDDKQSPKATSNNMLQDKLFLREIKELASAIPKIYFNSIVTSLERTYKKTRRDIVKTFFEVEAEKVCDWCFFFNAICGYMEYFYDQTLATKFMEYLCENYKDELIFKNQFTDLSDFKTVVDIYFSNDIFIKSDILVKAFLEFADENIL